MTSKQFAHQHRVAASVLLSARRKRVFVVTLVRFSQSRAPTFAVKILGMSSFVNGQPAKIRICAFRTTTLGTACSSRGSCSSPASARTTASAFTNRSATCRSSSRGQSLVSDLAMSASFCKIASFARSTIHNELARSATTPDVQGPRDQALQGSGRGNSSAQRKGWRSGVVRKHAQNRARRTHINIRRHSSNPKR
jgi:hypothetical protein